MSVSPDRRRAVFTCVFALARPNRKPGLLRLRGLDPALNYRLEDGRVFGGDELLSRGLPLSPVSGDFGSLQFFLTAEPPLQA